MNLNEHPELITRPEMHYVFVERAHHDTDALSCSPADSH